MTFSKDQRLMFWSVALVGIIGGVIGNFGVSSYFNMINQNYHWTSIITFVAFASFVIFVIFKIVKIIKNLSKPKSKKKRKMINSDKEILELKKMYIHQFEKFESKVFFAFLTLSVSLLILHFTAGISYWWGLGGLLVVTIILDSVLFFWRKKSFNNLIKEIKGGTMEEEI